MSSINCIDKFVINSGNNNAVNIKAKPSSFGEIYGSLLESKVSNGENNKEENNSTILDNNSVNYNVNQRSIDNAKVQAKFKTDINRLAKLMGIGPNTLMAVIGELKVNPKYYDFKIETNVDLAVNSLAAYFGISPMTMMAVFDKLKIDPNDLEDKKR